MLQVQELGLVPYREAHALQQQVLDARIAGTVPDTLLLLEHPPVITLGRGTDPNNVLRPEGFEVVAVERGGDVTLHAPGQLVGYLIRRLDEGARDLKKHLELLEAILIEALAAFGVGGRRVAGRTGVWVGPRKIASIGVACRRWCTWHGFALNVENDLELFAAVNPCGFDAAVMTSLWREARAPVTMAAARTRVGDAARRRWAAAVPRVERPEAAP